MFEGLMREAMQSLVETLNNDGTMIENKARICYRLDHPSKQIWTAGETFKIQIEPSGWSQTSGAGKLDLQYYFWLFIKCKPSTFGMNDEERLSALMEFLSEKIHGAKWGKLTAFLNRAIINYKSIIIKTNCRDIDFKLERDEIGATMMFWMVKKNWQELAEKVNGGELE